MTITPAPKYFFCPITKKIMVHPVMTVRGLSFERESILHWLQDHRTCPVSGTPLGASGLCTNVKLQWKIRYWQSNNKNYGTERDQQQQDTLPIMVVALLQRCLCPLTRKVMQDPVTIREGHNFERKALVQFIDQNGEISPFSGKPLGQPNFYPNKKLAWEIQHYCQQQQQQQEASHQSQQPASKEKPKVQRPVPVMTERPQEALSNKQANKTYEIVLPKKMSQEPTRSGISQTFFQNVSILQIDKDQDVLSIVNQVCELKLGA